MLVKLLLPCNRYDDARALLPRSRLWAVITPFRILSLLILFLSSTSPATNFVFFQIPTLASSFSRKGHHWELASSPVFCPTFDVLFFFIRPMYYCIHHTRDRLANLIVYFLLSFSIFHKNIHIRRTRHRGGTTGDLGEAAERHGRHRHGYCRGAHARGSASFGRR
ncbi:hypothetical protein IWX49DRAFT_198226 [Phyllosticta citricarpa]|uniref:Uncharacterized protein n=2 Tax=Phyllosticta TaxID=121621 RepID=A0ABR1LYE6_9PEZI